MTRGSSRQERRKRGPQARQSGSGTGKRPRRRRLFQRPVFRFVFFLLLLLGVFEVILMTPWVKDTLIPPYLRLHAQASGVVLSILGEDVNVSQSVVSSIRFSVNIKKGCDAIQPCVLFIAAVLASPVLFRPKVPGLVLGLAFLLVMNLVRVASLFYVGIYFRQYFDMMHHDVWQATFIVLSILAWAGWALWAAKLTGKIAHERT